MREVVANSNVYAIDSVLRKPYSDLLRKMVLGSISKEQGLERFRAVAAELQVRHTTVQGMPQGFWNVYEHSLYRYKYLELDLGSSVCFPCYLPGNSSVCEMEMSLEQCLTQYKEICARVERWIEHFDFCRSLLLRYEVERCCARRDRWSWVPTLVLGPVSDFHVSFLDGGAVV